MRKTALTAIIVTVTLGAAVYSLISIPPTANSALYYWLPITVGAFCAALLSSLRLPFAPDQRRASLTILRQNLLVGIVAGVLLYVQGLHVVTTVDAFLIVLAAILLELFFQAEKTDVRDVKTR